MAHSPRCNNGDIAQEEEQVEKTSQILTVCSDLPVDMLIEIMTSGLLLADRIRVTAVCKSWLVPSQEIRSMRVRIPARDQLPWIMTSQFTRKKIVTSSSESEELTCRRRREYFVRLRRSNHITCKLYDPCYNKQVPYVINHDKTTEKGVANRNRTGIDVDARACTSKQGWVMFYHTREVQYWSFFLYNPITGEIITQLPDLYSQKKFDVATFSTSPTSPDCVFFILKQDRIFTCRRGDKTWNRHIFDDDDHPHPRPIYKDAIYVDGSLFCVSSCGTLAAFSVAGQELTMLTTYFEPLLENRIIVGERVHMVEYNGELLLVTIIGDMLCKLFRFDKAGRIWVTKEGGLKDRALFVGECSSFSVSTVGKDALLNNIANKVYYHHFSVVDGSSTSQTKFCSFEDGSKGQCCEGSFEDIYGWVRERRQQRFWIQPPS